MKPTNPAARLLRAADRPAAAALLVAAVYGTYLLANLVLQGWDLGRFVTAGDKFADSASLTVEIPVLQSSDGYDGQFYFRMALDPFPDRAEGSGVTLDRPSYRNQRILYPLAARLLAIGRAVWVPAALVAVNYLAIVAIGYLGALLSRDLGNHSLLGALIAMNPGLLLALLRDLAEPVEVAMLLGVFLAARRARWGVAVAALILAVLARESAVLVAVAAGLVWVAKGWSNVETDAPPLWFAFVPVAAAGAWQLYLLQRWGTLPAMNAGFPPGFPLAGIAGGFRLAQAGNDDLPGLWLLEVPLLLAIWGAGVAALRSSAASLVEKAAFCLLLVLALTLREAVWESDWAFLRVGADATTMALLVTLGGRTRWKLVAGIATITLWSGVALLNLIG